MISLPASCGIVKQITFQVIDKEEIRDLSRWISGVSLFVISVVIFIFGIMLRDIHSFCIPVFTVMVLIFMYGFSPIIYMDKDDIKKTAVIIITAVVFITSSSLILDIIFTDKVDTYICYTTDTGECYHAKYCQYLRESAHETNVYKAKKRGYRSCSRCSPNEERYATTYQERHYLPAALIGAAIAGACFGGAVLIKKRIKAKNEQSTQL